MHDPDRPASMIITKSFLDDIRALIVNARATVARGVDLVQVHTNFEIGRRIVEQEQKGKNRAAYGEEIINTLSSRLTKEFGRGFSISNLQSMRQFYLQNQRRIGQSLTGQLLSAPVETSLPLPPPNLRTRSAKKVTTLKSQSPTGQLMSSPLSQPFVLSWTHYVFLLGIKNPDERRFYEIEASQESWTVRELRRQFNSSLYERLALSRDKKGIRELAKKGQIVTQPTDTLTAT